VALRQLDEGRVVHGSVVKLTLDAAGRVVILGGSYFPGATAKGTPRISAEGAIAKAAEGLGMPLQAMPVAISRDRGPTRKVVFENPAVDQRRGPWTAELVTFPMPSNGTALLAWETMIDGGSGSRETVLDARTGRVLYRNDHTAYAGPEGTVFTAQNPDGASRVVVSFAGAPFDNAGWVTDRATAGNNANAYEDANNDDVSDYQPQTPASPDPAYQHFTFPFSDAYATSGGTDIATDRDAAIVQAFYRVNWLHDYFYALGFDEAAGNFQDDNFGRGGVGGDGMLVEVHNGFTGGPAESSNTQTPPGQRPRLELNAALRDGALDADLVAHEYTHGVSNRLVMTEAVGGGLPEGTQTWALGEGWSDFFGTSLFDDPVAGEYVCGNPTTGCPLYAYDNSPLVYSDLCTLNPGCEPHRDGEIFTAALWDLRAVLGRFATEQLVIDGMIATTPNLATFLDARDGLLAADIATNAGANQCVIWRTFAGREMGVGAATAANQITVTADTGVPPGCLPVADAGGPYTTPEGTNAALNGGDSSGGSNSSAGGIDSYEWDLDGDGQYDDSTMATPAFARVGQDGLFTIGLRVTNEAGVSDTDSTTVTVTNVASVVSLAPIAAVSEGTAITLGGSGTDAGWQDTLSATVDWDDGGGPQSLSGTTEQVPPNATLTFTQGHTYGDNGSFVITVCVSDDDSTSCGTTTAQIGNVNPTATIGTEGQTTYAGVNAYLANAGGSVGVQATSSDPGSDDLTLTWDWDSGADTVVTSLVNPLAIDPLKSPSVQPRDVTLTRSHVYGDACTYDLEFRSADDDGGSASASGVVLIVGNATTMRGSGWWMGEYSPGPPDDFSAQTLDCYLGITVALSSVFDAPLSRSDATQILSVKTNKGTARQLLDRQLLAAWLNFANGAIGLGDPVDTNGDAVNDSTFGAAMLAAETVRINPTATRAQLIEQKGMIENIVLRDG
jgi:hypothetical protein